MGKRELLLILSFVVVGAVVYQATAPPSDPDEKGLSLSRFIEAARREIRGNRAVAEVSTAKSIPVDPEITELRIIGMVHDVEITGHDRDDIEAALRVHSRAYDDAEAKRYAEQTVLKSDRAGSSVTLEINYVKGHVNGHRTGQQRTALVLKIPSRIRTRIESRPAKLVIANVAGVEATNSGGEAAIRKIDGRVTVMQRNGTLAIEDVARLKLTSRNAEVKINRVTSDASITIEQGGELTASEIAGPLEVDCRNAEITLENLERTRGPIRINATNGTVNMKGLKSESRIDGRNAELNIAMTGAAPVTIYSDGAEVALAPPPDGFRIDAVIEGRIAPETIVTELGLEVTTDGDAKESRASGAVNGGGPTITIRTTRGDLTFREREKPRH